MTHQCQKQHNHYEVLKMFGILTTKWEKEGGSKIAHHDGRRCYFQMTLDVDTDEIEYKIVMGTKESTTCKMLISLAHELGHFADFQLNYLPKYKTNYDALMGWRNESDLKKEIVAWVNAVSILKRVGYSDWNSFIQEAVRCLKTYLIGKYENRLDDEDIYILLASRIIELYKEDKAKKKTIA